MMTIIISAFPGMGKTYSKKNIKEYDIVDHESSNYKWLEDPVKGRLVNPDFPDNYMSVLAGMLNSDNPPDVIFVSSHSEVRDALNRKRIPYYLISPYISCRDELIRRYKERGNSDKFCKQLYENWYKYLDSINNETWPTLIKFYPDHYIDLFLLEDLIDKSRDMEEKTQQFIKRKNNTDSLYSNSMFWSTASKQKKFTAEEIKRYSELIDWDILCKFNIVPAEIFTCGRFDNHLNWRYLNQNIKKYPPKIRKVISTHNSTS